MKARRLGRFAVGCLAMLSAGALARVDEGNDLYDVIRQNDLAKLERLLGAGASANAGDDRGVTPLMYAATAGSVDAMKLLINKGADVNAANSFGSTALVWSAIDIEKVRLLVEAGADVNAVSKEGRSALFVAAMSEDRKSVV